MSQKIKKLVTIFATSTSITKKIKETKEFESVSYIWYSVIFKDQIKAIQDSESKVNVIS